MTRDRERGEGREGGGGGRSIVSLFFFFFFFSPSLPLPSLVSIITKPLGFLISIPSALFRAVNRVRNGIKITSIFFSFDILALLPVHSIRKQGPTLIKQYHLTDSRLRRFLVNEIYEMSYARIFILFAIYL